MYRLSLLLALAGCDDLLRVADDFPDWFDDTGAVGGCADLEGDFVATDVRFADLEDPLREEGFVDLDVVIGFEAPNFATTLVDSFGDVTEELGNFEAEDDRLVLEDPLFPGMEPGLTALACERDGNVVRLSSALVGFDFDGDGSYDDASFEGTFVQR